MKSSRIWFLILFLCINLSSWGFSATKKENQPYQPLELVDPIKKYQKDPDFQYNDQKPEAKTNWLDELLRKFFSDPANVEIVKMILKILYWAIIIFAVLLIITRLFKINVFQLFKPASLPIASVIHAEELSDNIHELSFEDLIAQARKDQNHRRVVRLYFLWTLRKLSEKGIIEWKNEKTNREYLHEIKDQRVKQSFRQLSILFEYVWYGDYPTEATHSEQASRYFTETVS
jgi:hypothetical protein